jgi:hypothetical protein
VQIFGGSAFMKDADAGYSEGGRDRVELEEEDVDLT